MNPQESFKKLKKLSARKNYSATFADGIVEAVASSRELLNSTGIVQLNSRVEGKSYFAFQGDGKLTRAINKALYIDSDEDCIAGLRTVLNESVLELGATEINRLIYTAAISFCAATDLVKKKDQQTPGTFFEYLCAAIFVNALRVDPTKSLAVMNLDRDDRLPTDLIFDLGAEKPKFHVPVKTSTRERIIQVWAHQRVIDGVYGTGRFLGCPIVLGENKTDSKKREVSEICLPSQWRLYQLHIAQLWRIAYLDLPVPDSKLATVFPPVPVTTLGDLLTQGGDIESMVH